MTKCHKERLLLVGALAISGVAVLGCGDDSTSGSPNPDGCQGASAETTALDGEESALLGLINEYRQQNGAGALKACVSLNRAAQGHAEDMMERDYFEHNAQSPAPFGVEPWDRMCNACYDLACGVQTAVGENIAAGRMDAATTFADWKASPGHDANMREPEYSVIGIGRASGGGEYGVYWVNAFAGAEHVSCAE